MLIAISGTLDVYFDDGVWELLDEIDAWQRETIDEEGCGAVFGKLVEIYEDYNG